MMQPSLRVVSNDVARFATITTSPSAVPSLPASNALTDIKGNICRVESSEVVLNLSWSESRQVSFVGIPACNLSSDSEYRLVARESGSIVYDSDWQYAAQGTILDYGDFTQPLNVNSFLEGETIVSIWLDDHYMVDSVELHLRDPSRTYIDISRIIAGADFRPKWCASYGSSLSREDLTSVSRSAGGDLRIDRGPVFRVASLDIRAIHASDRHRFQRIMMAGLGKMHFVSVLQGHYDVTLEQDWSIYGVIEPGPLQFLSSRHHSTQWQIRSW